MAEFPALPFWTDAYLADCAHLSDAEHGRYCIMLFQMWRMPKARFPADDVWLARKFNRSMEVFVSEWKPLMQEYMHNDGNWWTQRKMQRVYTKLFSIREKNRASANARWEKEKDPCKGNASKTKTKTPKQHPSDVVVARATRWPPNLTVPADWILEGEASRARHGLKAINLAAEAEAFANYWASKSGKDATKLDWKKTWINWAMKAEGPRNANANGKGPTANDKFLAGVSTLFRSIEGEGDSDGPNPPRVPLLPS